MITIGNQIYDNNVRKICFSIFLFFLSCGSHSHPSNFDVTVREDNRARDHCRLFSCDTCVQGNKNDRVSCWSSSRTSWGPKHVDSKHSSDKKHGVYSAGLLLWSSMVEESFASAGITTTATKFSFVSRFLVPRYAV